MPRRPNPIFFIAIGVAFTVLAFGLNMGSGSEGDGAEPTATLVQETMPATMTAQPPPIPPTATPTATPVPATPESTATPLPDRTSCAAIAGTAYRSSTEREWYITNCISSLLERSRPDEAA
jgi:hypothetical protein